MSLAFQVACCCTEAGDKVLQLQADGVQLDHLDDRTLWRVLFQNGILTVTLARHYWVIDALDECSDAPTFLDWILSKSNELPFLRIFVTSRDTSELDRALSHIGPRPVHLFPLSVADTLPDIRHLVEQRIQALPVVVDQDKARMAETIVNKSQGSFLWTTLILNELLSCHSKNEVTKVLEEVPRDIESLYKRILDSMASIRRGTELAKAILMWVACAIHPLTVSELSEALGLDTGDSFPQFETSITTLCDQLVAVDKFQRVHVVHETVGELLLDKAFESEFLVDEIKAHTRLAKVCLTYLVNDEMKPPRTYRRRFSTDLTPKTTRLCSICPHSILIPSFKSEPTFFADIAIPSPTLQNKCPYLD